MTRTWQVSAQVLALAGAFALASCRPGEPTAQAAAPDPAAPGAPNAAPEPAKPAPPPTAAILSGTALHVRLEQTLDTRSNRSGDRFTATLDSPLVVDGKVVVPRGTPFVGHVVESKPSGRFKGRAVLALRLDSFDMNGQTYSLHSSTPARVSKGHKGRDFMFIGGGTAGGAGIGALAGGPIGAAIGAGAGAAAGLTGEGITGKKQLRLPVESRLTFTLQSTIDVPQAQ